MPHLVFLLNVANLRKPEQPALSWSSGLCPGRVDFGEVQAVTGRATSTPFLHASTVPTLSQMEILRLTRACVSLVACFLNVRTRSYRSYHQRD
jgi:hypothetical protein